MLKYIEEYAKKIFSARTHKDAYVKAMKWVASNIIADTELQNSVISYEKKFDKETQLPVIIVHLSVSLEEKEHRDRNCRVCKEVHSSFFMNEETNCSWCKAVAYQNRLDEFIKNKKSYYKERLGKKL